MKFASSPNVISLFGPLHALAHLPFITVVAAGITHYAIISCAALLVSCVAISLCLELS